MMKKQYHEALYDYIQKGGEGLTVSVKGRVFRFRLPLYGDIVNSSDYADYEYEKNAFLLSSSLQSVGGFPVDKSLRYDLVKILENLPKFTRRVIQYHWVCIQESQEYAKYFEAFCYTQKSKTLWEEWKYSAQFGFNLVAREYPLTDLQKSWISFNELEDKKETIEDEWGRAFFVASSMNPKGVEKAQRDWNSKRKKDSEFRAKIVEEANRGEEVDEKKREDLKSEKSIDELREEYWNWVEGREDNHDVSVREYKEQVQRHIDLRRNVIQRQSEQVREMAEQVHHLNSLSMSSPIRAYTDEEVAKMTQGRDRKVLNFDVDVEYAEHLSNKYLKSKKVSGGKIPSLQEQVSNRPTPKIKR